jgi:acetyl esterase/lipase
MSLLLTLKREREPFPGAGVLFCPWVDLALRHTNIPAGAQQVTGPMATTADTIRCAEAS